MFNYLHHIMFDPISKWEEFKAGILFSGLVFTLLTGLFCGAFTVAYIREHIRGWR